MPDQDGVKAATLDQTGMSLGMYRQRFRQEQYPLGARPRVVAQKLGDYCWHWLEPEKHTGAQVDEVVVLEEWVKRHRPTSLSEATTLLEDYLFEITRSPGTQNILIYVCIFLHFSQNPLFILSSALSDVYCEGSQS
uniref:SCAN box domain-containing protein n=1 Tax=Chelydra serpentina TaxID=8475 RepID=A0A8C3XJW0_CHESE